MKYRLPRQIVKEELLPFLSKEVKKQEDGALAPLPKKNLKELVTVSKVIETEGLPKKFILKKLPNDLGHGLFLSPKAKPIEAGTLIAPYAGIADLEAQNDPSDSAYAFAPIQDMTLTKEEHQQFGPDKSYHPKRQYSLSLDAEKKGNFTRFINHSTLPNVEAEAFRVPKNSLGLKPAPIEVFYRANTKILPGQQLLVCYEDEEESYWKPFNIEPFFMTPDTFKITKEMKLIQTDD